MAKGSVICIIRIDGFLFRNFREQFKGNIYSNYPTGLKIYNQKVPDLQKNERTDLRTTLRRS